MSRARGLGGRIALAAFAVALAAVATIATGILVLGSRLFEELMMAHGESRGAAQDKTTAAAAVSLACVEGNDCPAPQPSGCGTRAGSALQGRTRPNSGFTTRTLRRSATPIAAQRRMAASARWGDLIQR